MVRRYKTIFLETLKAAKRLFLEALGLLFIILSVGGFGSSVFEYRRYVTAPVNGSMRLYLTLLFAAAMLFSGLHTFWKARKIR